MATIIQINRINTNRSGAVSDVVTRLESATASEAITINAQHIQNLPIANTAGDLPTTRLSGQVTNAQVESIEGSKITTMIPASVIPGVNLTDVQEFADTAARNAATTITWHVGDVAIITGDAELGTYVYDGSTSGATDAGHTGATVDADWTLLRTPTASNLPASAIASGTFDDARIAATIARTNQLPTVVAGGGINVAQDSSGTSVQYTISSNATAPAFRFAQTAAIVESAPGTGVTTNQMTGNVLALTAAIFSEGTTALTTFPTSFAIYANGLKITDNEVDVNPGRTALSFTTVTGQASTGIAFPTDDTNRTLTFEISFF